MKLQLVVVSILAIIAYVHSVSVPEAVYDGPTYELKPVEEREVREIPDSEDSLDLAPVRQRRVTCDVFAWKSKWFSVNHSACAIKCLAQRRRGGSCRRGVCVCR